MFEALRPLSKQRNEGLSRGASSAPAAVRSAPQPQGADRPFLPELSQVQDAIEDRTEQWHVSHAHLRTNSALEYLSRISMEWESKSVHDSHAEIRLPLGKVELEATSDTLDIRVLSPSRRNIGLLEDLVSSHLDHLALGDDLDYRWEISITSSPPVSARPK